MHRELFYVRDGVLNKGAINFEIPISARVQDIHFLWWNADFTSKANYKLHVNIEDPKIMLQPSSYHINISHTGLVPKSPTYWRMSLLCNNITDGQAKIELSFQLNDLDFKITRLKYCQGQPKISQNPKPSKISSHLVFMYSLVVAFVILILTGIFVTFMQKKYSKKTEKVHKNEDPSPLLPNPNFPPNPGFSVYDGGMTSDAESRVTDWIQQQYMKGNRDFKTNTQTIEEVKTPEEIIKDIEVDRSRLKLGSLVQEGTFGKVFQGRFLEENGEVDVMIKTVMSWSSNTQSQLLVVEGVKLAGLQHKNILSPWAMTWDGTSPMFIYPYAMNGNLKQYLSKFTQAGLSTHQIVKYGIQTLAAMGHLHKRKLLHKDIAARNCL